MLLSNTIQALQLITLVLGLVLVAANMGAKGERLDQHSNELTELKRITGDLVKAQISSTKDGDAMKDTLKDLEQRMRYIENHR